VPCGLTAAASARYPSMQVSSVAIST
jgi:hypothetical protein